MKKLQQQNTTAFLQAALISLVVMSMWDVAGRQNVRQQTSAVVHTQPATTSPQVPVTSARAPVTSPPVPMTSSQGPMTSQQRNNAAAAMMQSATTADSMTYSRTTL